MKAALREADEEAGIDADDVGLAGLVHDDHGGWHYTTVLATALTDIDVVPNGESTELRWVRVDDVAALDLHPGFARAWPKVRTWLSELSEFLRRPPSTDTVRSSLKKGAS